MYAIIYLSETIEDAEVNTILQILNSNIDVDAWNAGDTNLEYQNATDHSDLVTKLDALNADWEDDFQLVYLKK